MFLQDSPTNQPAAVEEHVFFEHYKAYWGFHPFYGIQTHKWKYVYYYQEDLEEMYDLVADPDEIVNVVDSAEAAEMKAALRSRVSAWWQDTGALSVTPVKVQDAGEAWAKLV